MNLGDQQFFAIAEQIEKDLQLDMNLRDIFSNNLNNYFSFSLEDYQNSDIIEFNFEIEEGSAKIILENASDFYDIKVNDTFNEDLYYCMFINETLSKHVDSNVENISIEIIDNLYDLEKELINE